VSVDHINPPEVVANIRAARAKQQQMQAMLSAAEQAGKANVGLSRAAEPGSPAAALMGAANG
jgi:hypothetical protein